MKQDVAGAPFQPQESGAGVNLTGDKEAQESRPRLAASIEQATEDYLSKTVSTVTRDGELSLAVDEPAAGGSNPDVVEESGPVEYSDDEGLDDEEMQELAYEGDPLLPSDYEEEEGEDMWL